MPQFVDLPVEPVEQLNNKADIQIIVTHCLSSFKTVGCILKVVQHFDNLRKAIREPITLYSLFIFGKFISFLQDQLLLSAHLIFNDYVALGKLSYIVHILCIHAHS